MIVSKNTSLSAAILAAALAATPARALTAGEVLDEMNSDHHSGFFTGAVDMASHLFAVNGEHDKAQCAVDWFFRQENSVDEVYAFFETHRDRDAVAVLHVLINRKCGE